MAEQKVFLGPRVRRIRNSLGLTQTSMAADLDISPSYLNLIERNQRPLTVPLIIKLSSVYKIDPQELQVEGAGTLSALKEVFADREVVGIESEVLGEGGGGIHCITQQVPAV